MRKTIKTGIFILLSLMMMFSADVFAYAEDLSAAATDMIYLEDQADEAPDKSHNSGEIYLDDNMGYYGDRTDEVRRMLEETAEYTGWNIGVVTCDYDYDPERYGSSSATSKAGTKAEEIYDSVFGVDTDGVLYFCDVGTRYIVVANGARKYIVGSRFDSLLSTVNSKYMNYDDFGSVKAFADGVKDCYDRGEVTQDDLVSQGYDTFDENGYYHVDGKKKVTLADVLTALGIGFVISLIPVACVVYHYRVPKAPSADTYLDRNTVDIYRARNDLVKTRHYSYTNSSSSGGGGGHGGGGGFSGGHHGGGGMGGHR